MKFSKDYYKLLAHINPAIYDFIFPHGPQQLSSGSVSHTANFYAETQGSIFGTDYSGDLKVLAKFSWRMRNLIAKLSVVQVHTRLQQEQPATSGRGTNAYVSELIDEWCGNDIRFHFPPKPKGFDDKLTIEEKISGATIFAQAAFSLEGTEMESILFDGADKILTSALTQIGGNKTRQPAFADLALES